jgi:hypothetical protein
LQRFDRIDVTLDEASADPCYVGIFAGLQLAFVLWYQR